MRVTSQFFFDNFKSDNNKVKTELNRLTTQIASGQKIENSYDDSAVYTDLLRLESRESELSQIQERSFRSKSFTDASDSTLSEFGQSLRDFKTKLLQASNASVNSNNLESIANELEEQKKHMIALSNTQFDGKYLFSGGSVNTKPIDSEGKYYGNSDALMTLVGDGVLIQKNIDGESLFLGDDLKMQKSIETNVRLTNKISDEPLTEDSTIRDMVGDDDDDLTNDPSVYFYISSTQRDGTAQKDIVSIQPNEKIEDLLGKIKDSFGGDVKVELNDNGNISITDNKKGYSQIDFNMVAVQGVADSSQTDLKSITGDKIISFSKSNFERVDITLDESLQMDNFYFEKNGGILEGNVALISDGAFANSSTKLSEIMNTSPMPDKTFQMSITDVNGAAKSIELDLSATSTFSVDGTAYDIYSADETITAATDFTMGQLNNIIAMTLSNNLPASTPGSVSEFNSAIKDAKEIIDVEVNQNGHLKISDKSSNLSNIKFSMYDKDANDFSKLTTPSLSFMSNNAVTTTKADLNFFEEMDSVIDAVRNGFSSLNSESSDPRSIGIQNSISSLDKMHNHFNNAQSQIGIRSKSLGISEQKAAALKLNVTQLKSQTTEVDMAETIMKLNQITLNYQAMLQTVTKVNSLSLINYMK